MDCLVNSSVTHLLVTPTIALKNDMVRRAREHNIRVTDEIDEYQGQNLLMLVTDTAVSWGTINFLMELSSRNLLGDIFIDECHTFVTDLTFRESMNNSTIKTMEKINIIQLYSHDKNAFFQTRL